RDRGGPVAAAPRGGPRLDRVGPGRDADSDRRHVPRGGRDARRLGRRAGPGRRLRRRSLPRRGGGGMNPSISLRWWRALFVAGALIALSFGTARLARADTACAPTDLSCTGASVAPTVPPGPAGDT